MVPDEDGSATSFRRLDGGRLTFILIISALAFALFLFRAGDMPLTDPDEGRYAEISREMALSGDWIVPHLFGMPYLEKPPLLYWLTASALRAFGPSEIAARLAPALAGALGVLLGGAFARRHLSPAAGSLAAIVLASAALYVTLARTVVTDMLFAVALSGALFSFFTYREAATSEVARALSFWVFLAAATLSKGPAALLLCGLVLAGDAALGRSWLALFAPRLLVCAPLFFALALPWFAVVQHRYPSFLSFYLWKEHLGRAAGSEHAEPVYWFVPWVLCGLLPWTPLAIVAAPAWRTALAEGALEGRVVRFLLVWAGTVFVVFSLARGKLATYILPMFPPLAVLVGGFLDRVIAASVSKRSVELAFVASGLALLAGGAAAIVGATILPSGLAIARVVLLATPVLASGLTTVLWSKREAWKPLAALVFGACALYLGLAGAAPTLSRLFTARPLIAAVGQQLGSHDSYALWGKYLPSTAFYLERPPFLVGTRPELRFGKSLIGDSPTIVADLPELGKRTAGGRLFIFTDNRAKRERELRDGLGEVRLIARNYVASLWLRP
jgi:4-amino-4-deoxy-L-arabinose transferase-like glycosyltransferase